MSVLPFQPSRPEPDRADAMQWAEAQKALTIADAIAFAAYRARTVGDLPPDTAARCRELAAHALRSTSQEWIDAARSFAIVECTEALKHVRQHTGSDWTHSERETIARMLTRIVLSSFHAITEGSLVLPDDIYLRIAGGEQK